MTSITHDIWPVKWLSVLRPDTDGVQYTVILITCITCNLISFLRFAFSRGYFLLLLYYKHIYFFNQIFISFVFIWFFCISVDFAFFHHKTIIRLIMKIKKMWFLHELLPLPGPDTEDLEFTFRRSDNRPLPPGARTDKDTLYLTDVDESASGEYACVGRDRVSGVIRFTIYTTIEVLGKWWYFDDASCFLLYWEGSFLTVIAFSSSL